MQEKKLKKYFTFWNHPFPQYHLPSSYDKWLVALAKIQFYMLSITHNFFCIFIFVVFHFIYGYTISSLQRKPFFVFFFLSRKYFSECFFRYASNEIWETFLCKMQTGLCEINRQSHLGSYTSLSFIPLACLKYFFVN